MSSGAPSRPGALSRSDHALEVLEFGRVLEIVASRAVTGSGRRHVLSLRPSADAVAVRRVLARVAETRTMLEANPEWAPRPFLDARGPLKTLAMDGAVLEPAGVLAIVSLLSAAGELARALGDWIEETPDSTLTAIRDDLPVLPRLERALEGIVDDEGAVRDGASSDLRSVRRRLRAKRAEVVRSLESYVRGLPESIRVEDASISVRDGHFVVPIRREGRARVGGVVRGESATGATLFVEPPIGLRLAGEIHELEREEAAEVQRVLRDATATARGERVALALGFDALVAFDSLFARGRVAGEWSAAIPEIMEAGASGMTIVGGRHPLLIDLGVEVVPFDLTLAPGERVVVISGPNTGGKTVLLKAVGLAHLLAQSGVLPPVLEGTRLAIMSDVHADIGDEQSITESLSTFSAHMESARRILDSADRSSLVIFDEMGTGTDPVEGAALARAILEALVDAGSTVLVTSHLGELKRLDEVDGSIVNASLVFDVERLEPTFRLDMHRPGRSFGLLVARRLGIPESVLARAEKYVGTDVVEVDRLLADLQEKERALAEALASAERAGEEAEALRAEAEEARARLESRERTFERESRERARALLLEARDEVDAAIQEVRRADTDLDAARETRARRRIEEAAEEQRRRMPTEPSTVPHHDRPADLVPGARVRVGEASTAGVVREVEGDRVTVEVGGLRLRVGRDSVVPAGGGGGGAAQGHDASAAGIRPAAPVWEQFDLEARHEIDLRGLRVDEVDLALGKALDGAVVAGLAEVRIIHGKGTGAVKARVREILEDDRRVEAYRSGGEGEGGEGVTTVTLR